MIDNFQGENEKNISKEENNGLKVEITRPPSDV